MPRKSADSVPTEPVKAVRLDDEVGRYADVCSAVLSGAAKDALARWWLELCEARVLAFLVARGFRPTALPYNYLDVPPPSLSAVADNLRLLRCLCVVSVISITFILLFCELKSSRACWSATCASSTQRSWCP